MCVDGDVFHPRGRLYSDTAEPQLHARQPQRGWAACASTSISTSTSTSSPSVKGTKPTTGRGVEGKYLPSPIPPSEFEVDFDLMQYFDLLLLFWRLHYNCACKKLRFATKTVFCIDQWN